ncbi:alanine racemase [bacterium]|nr:alanine racemase [bacterium]
MIVGDEALALLGRPACYRVDLDVIEKNVRDMRTIIGPGVRLAAVLKADAYGHGAAAIAGTILDAGAALLAVATLSEALELRRAHPEAPILVMGYTPPALARAAVEHRIMPTLYDAGAATVFSDAALSASRKLPVHIKLDTGMNRLGIKAYEHPEKVIAAIAALPGLAIAGTFTHLALRNRASDLAQAALYRATLEACAARGIDPGLRHVCDSIGALRYPEFRLDMVRVGAAFFGVRPMRIGPEYDAYPFPAPAALVARIARIRALAEGEMVSYDDSWRAPEGGMRIATLPVGFADGYPRRFGNRAQVLVNGRRAPVVGLVCMDQAMIDLGDIEAEEGDEVVLLGAGIGLGEAADWGSTNRNEILCGIGRRVPRLYVGRGRAVAFDDRLSGSTLTWL